MTAQGDKTVAQVPDSVRNHSGGGFATGRELARPQFSILRRRLHAKVRFLFVSF
jgi:hypothetical protein